LYKSAGKPIPNSSQLLGEFCKVLKVNNTVAANISRRTVRKGNAD
jgi:hypothetical protein